MKENFNNIEEIVEYLENYEKASYYNKKPEINEKTDETTYYFGGLIYDSKIFKIPSFLLENNYIFKEYYNREKYPEFFKEDWHTWNYENIDVARISYLILRTYNIERMCEGAINNLASSGILLKLIKRSIELKDNN